MFPEGLLTFCIVELLSENPLPREAPYIPWLAVSLMLMLIFERLGLERFSRYIPLAGTTL